MPKDGIDREVITADICRYLGNDALVRPSQKEDSAGRRVEGYIINGYRNLTSAMIADLKADSTRWDQERRSAARSNVPYLNSRTHESRQYHGPTEGSAHAPSHAPSRDYVSSAPGGIPGQSAYDSSGQYPPSGYSQPPPVGYAGQQQYDSNYYVAGANMRMEVEEPPRRGVPPPASGFSGAPSGYAAPRTAYPQEDRSPYSQPVAQQPNSYTQPVYDGRASASVPTTYPQQMDSTAYDQGGFRDSSYPAQSGYSQPPMDPSYSTAGPANPRRNDRAREPDPRDSRDQRRRHH